MCGRYYIDYEVDLVLQAIYESLFQADPPAWAAAQRDVFPDTPAAVLVADGDGQRPVVKRWGVKRGNRSLVINARQETVETKPMFRAAFAPHRCVIPASGFYEWATAAGKKQKYRIKTKTAGPIYLAGLFLPDHEIDRYVILTTASTGDMQLIHHRSPVLLAADECQPYLHALAFARQRIARPNEPFRIEADQSQGPVQLSFLDLP